MTTVTVGMGNTTKEGPQMKCYQDDENQHMWSVITQTYNQAISEGYVTNHSSWTKIGFLPSETASVNTDVWSYGAIQALYIFPTAEIGMEVLSSDNTDDIAAVIHSGISTGGTTTSLISAGENFLTTTAVGDVVILDKSGANPEFGFISAIVSDTELTISEGFSYGGTGSGRAYAILDLSAKVGAQAIEIVYLDGTYTEKREIVLLNGTTVVPTVNLNLFRINSFRVMVAGTNNIPTGNITLRNLADTPVYSYITAGFNRARNIIYTVPANKTLFVTDFNSGYATSGGANKEWARVTTRANIDPTTKFKTHSMFYPFTDTISQNVTVNTQLQIPTKLPAKTDLRVSVITSASGIVIATLRGWLE